MAWPDCSRCSRPVRFVKWTIEEGTRTDCWRCQVTEATTFEWPVFRGQQITEMRCPICNGKTVKVHDSTPPDTWVCKFECQCSVLIEGCDLQICCACENNDDYREMAALADAIERRANALDAHIRQLTDRWHAIRDSRLQLFRDIVERQNNTYLRGE